MKLLVVACLLAVATAYLSFDGHSVIRLKIDTAKHTAAEREVVRALHERNDVDFWSELDIRVNPQNKEDVLNYLAANGVAWETLIDDVQPLLQAENQFHAEMAAAEAGQSKNEMFRSVNGAPPDFFKDYRKLDDINAFIWSLVAQYPNLAKNMSIGSSYEGRTIYGVVVASSKTPANRKIYYHGGIHCREWIAHATVAYVLWSLLSNYGTDPVTTKLVDNIEWHIVPALNVDGYVYTWTKDRMWRKTRSPNSGSSCVGTDANRNWGVHWCEQGASHDPCSDIFCGKAAFSEKETQSVRDYMTKVGSFVGSIDFHSYSQLWMSPYAWTSAKPKDYDAHIGLSHAAVAAIKNNGGKIYKDGPIFTTIYPASGNAVDWAYDVGKVKYPYAVELRDTGQYGFLLPASQIIPSGVEIWAAVQVMAQYILDHP